MVLNFFTTLKDLHRKIKELEKKIEFLEFHLEKSQRLNKSFFTRLLTGSPITADMVQSQIHYYDLRPEEAKKVLREEKRPYLLIDVSMADYKAPLELKNSLHIPLETLATRLHEIPTRSIPIYLISENGIRSLMACEILEQHGFFHVSNISGGYEFFSKTP